MVGTRVIGSIGSNDKGNRAEPVGNDSTAGQGQGFNLQLITAMSQEQNMGHELQAPSSVSYGPRWRLAHLNKVPPGSWSLTWSREGWGLRKRLKSFFLRRRWKPGKQTPNQGPRSWSHVQQEAQVWEKGLKTRSGPSKWEAGWRDTTGAGHALTSLLPKAEPAAYGQ